MKRSEEELEKILIERALIQQRKRQEGFVPLTKENFFERHKPITGVFMEKKGEPVTSTRVLEILSKGKQFMEKGDVKGFGDVMSGQEVEALTDEESDLFYKTVITEKGLTVFWVLESLDDLLLDEEETEDNLNERINDN